MKKFCVPLIFLALLQTGCSLNSPFVPIQNTGERISQYGLSILPPTGGEWLLMKQSPYGGIVFAKSIHRSEHTWSCHLMLIQMNVQVDSPEEYLKYLKVEKDKDNDPGRFEVLTNDFQLDNRFGDFSVKYVLKANDKSPVTEIGEPLILKAFGYMFQYPHDHNFVVEIGCSERSAHEDFSASIKVVGNKFIDSLIIN